MSGEVEEVKEVSQLHKTQASVSLYLEETAPQTEETLVNSREGVAQVEATPEMEEQVAQVLSE